MKLLTKEIERKLESHPFCSQEKKGKGAEVIVRFFNPYGVGDWLITEGERQEDGDWLLFGYCRISDWEWGYVSLKELESIKMFGGLGIERDLYTGGKKTVNEVLDYLR